MGDLGELPQPKKKSNSLFLQIVVNPDGTVSRPSTPLVPPTADDAASSVISKDAVLNSANNTWLRLYLPKNIPDNKLLPIILYFHGGGFVLFSAASIFYNAFCEQLAVTLPAIVISIDYRLAPEHRLPAAYEDAVESLLWLKSQAAADPWLVKHGDFSRCFLMGHSSGANMAYHAALRVSAMTNELKPVTLAGIILNQPYFGGIERTRSELDSEEDEILPLRASDNMWQLALPKGAERDHEFCEPKTVSRELMPKCMVKGYVGDPLYDRQKMIAEKMKDAGVQVVALLEDSGFHAVELFVPAKAQSLLEEVKEFVYI